jgi:anti-sigma factor RsiW
MKHFTIWQLTDLARGLVEVGPARSAMETHLPGCPRCERIVNVLRRVIATAHAEAGYEPPERAIRHAQAIYSLYGPEKISFPRLIARLVYDSGRAPLPAGMRSQNRLSRHALYEAGNYCLDVQLEQQPGSGLVSLTGQLADRNKPPTSTADLPVRLMERKSLVTSTLSNRLGEFRLEYAPARNLRLQLPLPSARKRLEVSLSQLYAGDLATRRPGKVASRHAGRKRGRK